MIDSTVATAVVTGICSVIGTYLTVKYRHQQTAKEAKSVEPKDRIDTAFDLYESFMKEQQRDLDRKSQVIDHLQEALDKQREETRKAQDLIDDLRYELENSRRRVSELENQIVEIKAIYQSQKSEESKVA